MSRRTKVGRALHKWRMELLDDLGGIEAVSTQELALVEEGEPLVLIDPTAQAGALELPAVREAAVRLLCMLAPG